MGAQEAGILVEIIGAAFLVWRTRGSTRALREFPQITYDNFATALAELVKISRGQFTDQLKGFGLLAIGLLLQLGGGLLY